MTQCGADAARVMCEPTWVNVKDKEREQLGPRFALISVSCRQSTRQKDTIQNIHSQFHIFWFGLNGWRQTLWSVDRAVFHFLQYLPARLGEQHCSIFINSELWITEMKWNSNSYSVIWSSLMAWTLWTVEPSQFTNSCIITWPSVIFINISWVMYFCNFLLQRVLRTCSLVTSGLTVNSLKVGMI